MSTIGVVVFCDVEMNPPDRCLQNVQWADDVAIVSLGEAQRRARTVGGWQQRRRQTDWILHLWAGERVEKELAEQLSSLRRIPLAEARSAYKIPVRSYLLGKWVDGSIWGPSPSLRVTRELRSWPSAWWNPDAREPGQPALLSGYIEDTSATDLGSAIELMNTLTSSWAEELNCRGRGPGLTQAGLRSFFVLLRLCARSSAFRDGLAGLTLSMLGAYATLLVGAKEWERSKFLAAPAARSMDKPRGPDDA
jgi:hypothetical protein